MVQYVKIYYGPYEAFHTLSHKPQKLYGLRDRLRKLGYRVDLVPVPFRDYCLLEMCGHEVFRCSIKNLQFNTPCELDPICQRAVEAVTESSVKFLRARNYFWFWSLIEDQIFVRSEYAPKDHWPFDVNIIPYSSCIECINCCDLLVQKKEKN